MKTRTTLFALLLASSAPMAQPTLAAPPPAQAAAATVQGEVLETRDVDSYTYLRLKTRQGEIWAAVPTTTVRPGAQVTIGNAMVMNHFESKTLKKTFDKIVFGQIAGAGTAPAAAHGMPAAAAAAEPAPLKLAKASGPGAKTVAEVVTGKGALKDKTVTVHGQVVKASLGILGKNWLHLRDGTGSAADGSNDIVVTTKNSAAVGDVVNAKGTVRTDVTVGPGYAYAVLIDDAALSK